MSRTVFSCKRCLICADFSPDSDGTPFFWRKRYYGLRTHISAKSNGLKLTTIFLYNLFLTNLQLLASQDVNWWTGVVWITCGLLWCFYQLFIHSFWRHPFTAEHPLVSKWYNDKFSKFKETNSISDGLGVSKCSANVFFFGELFLKRV